MNKGVVWQCRSMILRHDIESVAWWNPFRTNGEQAKSMIVR
jgi:hypothetical protein